MWKIQDNDNNDNDDDNGQRKNVSQNKAYKPSAQVSWTLDRGRNSTYLEVCPTYIQVNYIFFF